MFLFFKIIPKKKFVLCLILMIITSTSNAFTSWLFSDIIRSATRQENSKIITLMGISIFAYSIFFFFSYFETKMITELTFIFNTEIKKTVVNFLLYQPNNQVDLGKELSFMSTDLKLLEQNYLASFFHLFKFMATFSISLTVAVLYDVRMALIFIFFSLIPLVVPRMFEQRIKNSSQLWSKNNATFLAFFKETLSGLSDIQQLSAQSFFYTKNDAQMESMENSLKNMNFVTSITSTSTNTLGTICFFFPIMLGGLFVSRGSLEIATLIGLIQLSNSIVNPLLSGISLISTFHTVEPILSKLLDYSLFKPLDPQHIQNSIHYESKIICTDLEIYRHGLSLFEPLTTTITSGQKVVIIGDSGVGKSTLLALIKDTTSISYKGEILVEKNDLLLIPQTPFLINRSLKDNICFGESFPDDLYKDILTKTDYNRYQKNYLILI